MSPPEKVKRRLGYAAIENRNGWGRELYRLEKQQGPTPEVRGKRKTKRHGKHYKERNEGRTIERKEVEEEREDGELQSRKRRKNIKKKAEAGRRRLKGQERAGS